MRPRSVRPACDRAFVPCRHHRPAAAARSLIESPRPIAAGHNVERIDIMCVDLPAAGAAAPELARRVHQEWTAAAAQAGLDLTGFDPAAPLADRLTWARGRSLDLAAILSRFSTDVQQSTESQVRECCEFAARHRLYCPPEYVCVDEAVSGRKQRRDGLDRVRLILQERCATTLLVFKVSRLFRVAYLGYAFFQEEVVEEGLRAISVSQGIDTADAKTWKGLAYLHGLMDEMLVGTIADGVRAGLKSLFQQGYVTGALPVGYHAVEVPGAPRTKLDKPRTMPAVTPTVADLIRQHYRWVVDGMGLMEGWRRWVAAGGPCDPRATLGYLSYPAYRRLLSNPRYVGLWAFGRKRNVWSSKRDYTQQVLQPDTEVVVRRCEELRIVDDALFYAVQRRLADFKMGPRGPKRRKAPQLWDRVTDQFWCPHCDVRYYQNGLSGRGMRCKRGTLCRHHSAVRRDEAVRAVCRRLAERVRGDEALVAAVVARAEELDAEGDEAVRAEIAAAERRIAALDRKVEDLTEWAGQGSDADRAALKAKVVEALAQRNGQRAELARLQKQLDAGAAAIAPEAVRAVLADFVTLLEDAAAGALGPDAVFRAVAVFRALTGGRIWVYVEPRVGRQGTTVRGVFRPAIVAAVRRELGAPGGGEPAAAEEQVWLRPPPKVDELAERVHQLIDGDGLSFERAAEALRHEGHTVNGGNVWVMYHRYYEMHDRPVPPRPAAGRPPRSAAG
jgi:DNA invertase Pin-like site-specific DNA recombinase